MRPADNECQKALARIVFVPDEDRLTVILWSPSS